MKKKHNNIYFTEEVKQEKTIQFFKRIKKIELFNECYFISNLKSNKQN